MAELLILVVAICVLAVLIDHFRGFDITGHQVALFGRGDAVRVRGLRGETYRIVRVHFDRDMLRVRRCWRG